MKYLLLFAFGLIIRPAMAQYNLPTGNSWIFGTRAGVDFSGPAPTSFLSSVNTLGNSGNEACASVADNSGNLLFYTNGEYVWDNTHALMQNGNIGIIASTTTQGALIVPYPGSPSRYYIFSVEPADGITSQRMFYSIVDMNLNGGLGGVEAANKAILISNDKLQEKMTVLPGEDCSVWVMTKTHGTNYFKAFKIDYTGLVTTPVISVVSPNPVPGAFIQGMLKYAPDSNRLFECTKMGLYGTIESYSFNKATGQVSNRRLIDQSTNIGYYGICLSPHQTKLYASTGFAAGRIYQFDLSLPTAAAVTASRTLVHTMNNDMGVGDIKEAPNGKLYFARPGLNYLHAINQPDQPGLLCQVSLNAIQLAAGSTAEWGLPSVVIKRPFLGADTIKTHWKDTVTCIDAQVSFTIRPGRQVANIVWNDNTTGRSNTFTGPGKYWATFIMNCQVYTDTFTILRPATSIDLGSDTAICADTWMVIPRIQGTALSYRWQDGSTRPYYNATRSGQVVVNADVDGCNLTDTMNVRFVKLLADLGQDITRCSGEAIDIPLAVNLPTGADARWSTGSTDAQIVARQFGGYSVTVSFPGCEPVTDSINIGSEICDCAASVPNAFTPNGDGRNDVFKAVFASDCLILGYYMRVYNRWGECVFMSYDAKLGWDGTHNGNPAPMGTYFFHISLEKGTGSNKFYQKGEVTLIR